MNKYLKWGIIIFEVILIISLIQGIGKARKSRTRVGGLVVIKNELVEERKELLKQLEYVQGKDYLEKIAREELSLSKEGEVVVIVPESSSQYVVRSDQGGEGEEVSAKGGWDDVPNWEKWLAVFGVE